VIEAALKAARVLATNHGLPAADLVVLHAGSNVVVHLAPAPVVVRVMTGTAGLHGDPAAWLEREVGVCLHLERLGAAIVAPSDAMPPGPHHVEGLWMTCWAHVAVDRAAPNPPPEELGRALRDLHVAMSQVPVELEPLSAVREELSGLLDRLDVLDDRRADAWRAQRSTVSADAFSKAGSASQPVHGDASLSNLLTTTDGRRLWADFEDVRRGPIEADVAGLIDAARNRRFGNDYETALLSAYGTVDADIYDAHLQLHALYGAVWRAYHPS